MSRNIEWQDARHMDVAYARGGTVIGEHSVDEKAAALILHDLDQVFVLEGTLPELHRKVSEMMEALTELMARTPDVMWAGHSFEWTAS